MAQNARVDLSTVSFVNFSCPQVQELIKAFLELEAHHEFIDGKFIRHPKRLSAAFIKEHLECPDEEARILGIRPNVLWETRVAFCSANAASGGVTAIPVQQRTGVSAFQAMFDDFGTKVRASMGLADAHPTNPQAEVLLLDGVPLKYVIGAYALNQNQKTRIEEKHPGFQVVVNAGVYRYAAALYVSLNERGLLTDAVLRDKATYLRVISTGEVSNAHEDSSTQNSLGF